jgi:hypothetical protein
MFGFDRLRMKQPPGLRHTVFEIKVDNWIGRWWRSRGWGAVTLPFIQVGFILYWMLPNEKVSPFTRLHEFVHVEQWERPGPFYVQYVKALLKDGAYKENDFEEEAFKRVVEAVKHGLPEWTYSAC